MTTSPSPDDPSPQGATHAPQNGKAFTQAPAAVPAHDGGATGELSPTGAPAEDGGATGQHPLAAGQADGHGATHAAPGSRRRVALLNSPYILNEPFFQSLPPLSLLYLAAALDAKGHAVSLHNVAFLEQQESLYYFGHRMEELFTALAGFAPEVIGVTVPYSARWVFAKRLVQALKQRFPGVPVVLGGIHPTAFPAEVLEQSPADCVVLGEGEESILQVVERLSQGQPLDEVDGVAFRKGGQVVENAKTRFIDDLDGLPWPAYHLLDMEKLKQDCAGDAISQLKGMYFALLTSRSCPNQCTYCNMFLAHGRKWRSRSPQSVLDEVKHLVNTYGVRQFAIMDDNFTFSKRRALEILKGLAALEKPIRFITPNGLSLKALDDELVGWLKKAGALEISIAIESGSEYIRNQVYKKRVKIENIYDIVAACKRHNLPVRAFYMVGAPQETDATVQDTIDVMRRIKIPGYINITTPYKGTAMYDEFKRLYNLDDADLGANSLVDIRLPIEKAANYAQILSWRRKLQFYNILYSWRELFSRQFINLNTLKRFWMGVVRPGKTSRQDVDALLSRWIPLAGEGR